MSKTVGIDLGTTNSAVGIMVDGMPRLIPNAIGKYLTPSVIGIDESGEVLVGSSAKEYQTLQPERCVSGFKRRMGTNWNCKIDSHTFSAIELSSLVLGSLKGDAESHLNTQIHNAVITVPAYFNNDQRQATIEAGKIAGFQVERIINEPTAAALAYGVHETDTEKTIAVFDLGGGTFDISIVDFFEGAIEVRSSAGEAILGGEDFTRALAMAVLNEHSIIFEHAEVKSPKMVARLIQQCENAKVALSKSDSFEIFIPDSNGDLAPEAKKFTVDRSLLNEACEPILSRIAIPIRRAMGDAKLTTLANHTRNSVGKRDWESLSRLVLRFFNRHEFPNFRSARIPILNFCIDHQISPSTLGQQTSRFLKDPESPTWDSIIQNDGPLNCVFNACQSIDS